MKTILVPTEHGAAMASALDTALLLARKFDSFIEGFSLRPAVADLVAMDPDSGLTMVAVKENDAEMVRQAEDLFRAFMTQHQVPLNTGTAQPTPSFSWLDSAPSGHDFVGSYGRVFDAIVLARPGDEWQSPSMVTLESALFESGRPVLMLVPAVMVRRKASRCRKFSWLMISPAAVPARMPSAASRSWPISSSTGIAVVFMVMPPGRNEVVAAG